MANDTTYPTWLPNDADLFLMQVQGELDFHGTNSKANATTMYEDLSKANPGIPINVARIHIDETETFTYVQPTQESKLTSTPI